MNDKITMCTVTFNAYYAAALMWESFLKYHDKPKLLVFDQGSKDGTYEYFKDKADLILTGHNTGHGMRLDELCKRVETPYTLVVDSDVQFLGNIYEQIEWQSKPFAICLRQNTGYYPQMIFSGIEDEKGIPLLLTPQARFQIHCTIFDTAKLQYLLSKNISFGFYVHPGYKQVYETGSIITKVAECLGWTTYQPKDFKEKIHHWGGITNVLYAGRCKNQENDKKNDYLKIKAHLEQLRSSNKVKFF
jgi:hypothetical protein